jgi:hypothetical protein
MFLRWEVRSLLLNSYKYLFKLCSIERPNLSRRGSRLSRKVKSPCVVYVMDSLHLSNSNMTMVKTPADGQKTSVSDPGSIRSGDPDLDSEFTDPERQNIPTKIKKN